MIPFPDKKYQIIYADPPWRYEFSPKAGASIERKYPTMTIKEICLLPVEKLCDKNCFLFLWTTMPKLEESFEVIKNWGFIYRTTAFVWVKTSNQHLSKPRYLGAGCYTRPNIEIILLARNGKDKLFLKSKKIEQIIMLPRLLHSQKPSEARNRIVQLMGDLPRIELFARPPKNRLFEDESYRGWDLWGNEC